jgi:hypothetical protein
MAGVLPDLSDIKEFEVYGVSGRILEHVILNKKRGVESALFAFGCIWMHRFRPGT